jgi:hypothetical protein
MSCGKSNLVSYYSDKINIYQSEYFIPLPNIRACPPPSMPIYQPLSYCGQPYPTPTYYPPYPSCTSCNRCYNQNI